MIFLAGFRNVRYYVHQLKKLIVLQIHELREPLLHVPAQRAVRASRHRGAHRRLPGPGTRGRRARHRLQRAQDLRPQPVTANSRASASDHAIFGLSQ